MKRAKLKRRFELSAIRCAKEVVRLQRAGKWSLWVSPEHQQIAAKFLIEITRLGNAVDRL